MIKKIAKLFDATYFKMLMILILIPMLVPYVHFYYGGIIKIGLAYGLVACVFELLINRKSIFELDKVSKALILFLLSYLVSIIVNYKNNLTTNIKDFVYMSVFVFLFFIVLLNGREKDIKREIKTVSFLIVAISFVTSLISFLMFLLNIRDSYSLEETSLGNSIESWHNIGFVSGRLYGLFNANAGAMINLISIILSLYLVFVFKKSKSSITFLMVANIVVQYLCLILTSCRGAILTSLIIIFVLILVSLCKNVKKEFSFRIAILVVLTSIIVLGFAIVSFAIYKGMLNLPNCISKFIPDESIPIVDLNIIQSNTIEIDLLNQKNGSQREVDIATDISTGRLDLWEAGLLVFKDSPLFGLTREGFVTPVYNLIYERTGQYNNSVINSGLHNIYLTVLVSSGIIGFIVLSYVAIFVIYRAIYVIVKAPKIDNEILFSFLLTLAFFISEFVESRILYQANIFSVVFWVFFAYLYCLSNAEFKKYKANEGSIK